MGYSGRYHAASLVAVFIALAIGILIGIGLADDVTSSATQEVEQSLRDDRDAADDKATDLQNQLDIEQQFSDAAYPALVNGRLDRQEFAVIELGKVSDDQVKPIADDAIDAAQQAGGDLASVGSIELPLDVDALSQAVGGKFKDGKRDPEMLERLGRVVGFKLAGGGDLIDRVKPDLFTHFNGSLTDVSRLILISNPPDDLGEGEQQRYDALETGLIEGAKEGAVGTVGVEITSTDPTTLSVFSDLDVPTVDNADESAGKVSIVYSLDGATGDYGTKDGASSLLPALVPGQPSP